MKPPGRCKIRKKDLLWALWAALSSFELPAPPPLPPPVSPLAKVSAAITSIIVFITFLNLYDCKFISKIVWFEKNIFENSYAYSLNLSTVCNTVCIFLLFVIFVLYFWAILNFVPNL